MTLRAICSSLTYAGSSIIAAFSKVGNSISSALKSARELVQSVWNRVFPKTENQVPAHSLAGRVTLPPSRAGTGDSIETSASLDDDNGPDSETGSVRSNDSEEAAEVEEEEDAAEQTAIVPYTKPLHVILEEQKAAEFARRMANSFQFMQASDGLLKRFQRIPKAAELESPDVQAQLEQPQELVQRPVVQSSKINESKSSWVEPKTIFAGLAVVTVAAIAAAAFARLRR
jgi:hypothetical protein